MDFSTDFENYILNNSDKEDVILQELNRETQLKFVHGRMVSGHIQGLVLSMISKMIQPGNILELGTYTGYSAICLSKGLKSDGKIYTIEIDDELKDFSWGYFEKAGISDSVVQITGDALYEIPKLDQYFDLVYIDADKREYSNFYDLVFNKVNRGGYIIADNTLWGGKIINQITSKDNQTRGIVEFNKMVSDDPRVEKVILPLHDGITIIRKK